MLLSVMRPPKHRQSALWGALNHVLGTEASVRILRVLAQDGTQVTRGELARRAGLEPRGTSLAVHRLQEAGLIQAVGQGARQLVALREQHPLAPGVRQLFACERERVERVVAGVRAAVAARNTRVEAAWLEGAFANGSDSLGQALALSVLASSAMVDDEVHELQCALVGLQAAEDVTIEVSGLTRADLNAIDPARQALVRSALPVWGPAPGAVAAWAAPWDVPGSPHRHTLHAAKDAQALRFASAIAEKIASDANIVSAARSYVHARLHAASAYERADLEEWDRVLSSMSGARLRRFLVDRGERATRLRQTMPFPGVLSEQERRSLLGGSDEAV